MKEQRKFDIDIEELQGLSVFLATPMYGGMCSGNYLKSVIDLHLLFKACNINVQFFALMNESLITRARNYCVDEFLRSGHTHLLFIDSDIEFNPLDILALLYIEKNRQDIDIIGAPYVKKSISWEKIKKAVDKGYADENPFELERFAGDFVFNPLQGSGPIGEPLEVSELGTGYMLVPRRVFEVWNVERPEYLYKPDHVRAKEFDGTRRIMAYFQDPFNFQGNDRHLSEDYFFCQESRNLGMRIWMCPWMITGHIGSYKFVGDLGAVAATGMSATADLEQVQGLKK